MATTSQITISIVFISVIGGIFLFYLTSDLPKEQRKKMIGEMASQLINFFLFMWAGKILFHFPVFVADPMAILGYPSDSRAFYAAVLGSGLLLSYMVKRGQLNGLAVGKAFVHLFLFMALLHEVIQYAWNNQTDSIGSLLLVAVLLVLFTFLDGRMTTDKLLGLLLTSWTAGNVLLLMIQPYITLFGYIIKLWFLVLFYAVTMLMLLLHYRKGERYERN